MDLRAPVILFILSHSATHGSSCKTFDCYQDASFRCVTSQQADEHTCQQRIDRAISAARTEDEQLEAAFGRVARKMHTINLLYRQSSMDETLIAKWQEVDATSQLCMKQWSREHYLKWRRAYLDAKQYMKSKDLPLP